LKPKARESGDKLWSGSSVIRSRGYTKNTKIELSWRWALTYSEYPLCRPPGGW